METSKNVLKPHSSGYTNTVWTGVDMSHTQQVARDGHYENKICIYTSWWQEEKTPAHVTEEHDATTKSRQHKGKFWLTCASCNRLLHPALTSAQDGLDPPQLVPLFCQSSANVIGYIAYTHGADHLQLAPVLFMPNNPFTDVHKHMDTWVRIISVVVIDWWIVSYCGEACSVVVPAVCVWWWLYGLA